jgi:hypothetical protein
MDLNAPLQRISADRAGFLEHRDLLTRPSWLNRARRPLSSDALEKTMTVNGSTFAEHVQLAHQGFTAAKEFVRIGKVADAAESMRYATWHLEQVLILFQPKQPVGPERRPAPPRASVR